MYVYHLDELRRLHIFVFLVTLFSHEHVGFHHLDFEIVIYGKYYKDLNQSIAILFCFALMARSYIIY